MATGEFRIDDRLVSESEFHRLLATLTERLEWFCDDETDGGTTGYRARATGGAWYDVRFESRSDGTRSSITASSE